MRERNTPPNMPNIPADFLDKTTPIACPCGNHTFVPVTLLRRVSAIISPNGEEAILPYPTFACNSCGAIPKETMPTFLAVDAANTESSKSGIIATPEASTSKPKLTLVRD